MQYKWPLFPIQPEVFLRFSLHLQRDICVLNSGYANQTQNVRIYLLYADHRLLTKPFDKNRRIHHLPLEPLYILAGGAMHDLMSPYRH